MPIGGFTPQPSPFVVNIVQTRRNVGTRITPARGSGGILGQINIVGGVPDELFSLSANFVGQLAVDILSGGQSYWPVATGLSKSSFYYTTSSRGADIRNFQEYARYVEERHGYIERTLDENNDNIGRQLAEFLANRLVNG